MKAKEFEQGDVILTKHHGESVVAEQAPYAKLTRFQGIALPPYRYWETLDGKMRVGDILSVTRNGVEIWRYSGKRP